MTKYIIFIICIFTLVGCGQKTDKTSKESLDITGEAEELTTDEIQPVNLVSEEPAQTNTQSTTATAAESVPAPALTESNPQKLSVEPTAKDLQQALKNAGFYQGKIDGVVGPRTKKAIEDFQSQNSLKPDGKVGPKTWDKLKGFLTSANNTATPQAAGAQ